MKQVLGMNSAVNAPTMCFDRYIFGTQSSHVDYFLSHLFAPHNRRERGLNTVLQALPAGLRRMLLMSLAKKDDLQCSDIPIPDQLNKSILRNPDTCQGANSFIQTLDYSESQRGQLVALVFDNLLEEAGFLIKYRNNSEQILSNEATQLNEIRASLPAALQSTLPRVVQFMAMGDQEWLCETVLPGRSAYVELKQSWFPTQLIRKHLNGAIDWLIHFQSSNNKKNRLHIDETKFTNLVGQCRQADLAGTLLEQAQTILNDSQMLLVPSHGDFWARNLLFDENGLTGVVDWEHAEQQASPWNDLFFMLLSYAGEFCARNREKCQSIQQRLNNAFIQSTAISKINREVLQKFSQRQGLPLSRLRPMLGWYLLQQASEHKGNKREDLYQEFLSGYTLLEQRPCFAFSG